MQKTQEELKANILSALAHPNRIRILEFLKNGVKCNCEIAPALDLEQSNLSRHMKILVQEGIVISWKEGLRVNYRIIDERIIDIINTAGSVARKEAQQRIKTLGKS
ncbi:MAG TPA: metalloregulator ArsR/SmtB family transcription factor [Ignavibacteriaceae bacterium]|nr:metalloregulator ArsR/SmtB family transcription factor [Ignavibacteriaceae bacterium]